MLRGRRISNYAHLDIQKGANAAKQQYETPPEELPHHTEVTLRAVRNWLGTGRTFVADAAFGPVKTCVELLKRDMYFIEIIKGYLWPSSIP